MQEIQNSVDSGMFAKGYRYKLIPIDATFEPLYSKTLSGITSLMVDYKNVHFEVIHLQKLKALESLGVLN